AMRVGRKTRNLLAVVHAPAVLAAEVHADVAPAQQGRVRPQTAVAPGVMVLVVGGEDEGIDAGHLRPQRLGAEDQIAVVHSLGSFKAMACTTAPRPVW